VRAIFLFHPRFLKRYRKCNRRKSPLLFLPKQILSHSTRRIKRFIVISIVIRCKVSQSHQSLLNRQCHCSFLRLQEKLNERVNRDFLFWLVDNFHPRQCHRRLLLLLPLLLTLVVHPAIACLLPLSLIAIVPRSLYVFLFSMR
jgi:hypothetical protein